MRPLARPATDEIGMRRKPSFYFSRWSRVAGRSIWIFCRTTDSS
jgi:hypothetical protein